MISEHLTPQEWIDNSCQILWNGVHNFPDALLLLISGLARTPWPSLHRDDAKEGIS